MGLNGPATLCHTFQTACKKDYIIRHFTVRFEHKIAKFKMYEKKLPPPRARQEGYFRDFQDKALFSITMLTIKTSYIFTPARCIQCHHSNALAPESKNKRYDNCFTYT